MNNDIAEMTFEQARDALMNAIEQMESEALPLDEAVKLYERGQHLAHRCEQLLDEAELRIQELDGD